MMKLFQRLLMVLSISITAMTQAQEKKKDSTLVNKNNYLDMGAGTLTDIFGSNLDGNKDGKKLSFLEMVEKMDLPAEQKTEYKNLYYLQSKNLTEKQKDSLGKAISKKIKEAKPVGE
ncbi:hypothetical protein QLS71_014175 [Mariniflexile litorale]|uniref:DUF4296 domain-containing protein n=1 Tax=Mariniflexile litorale TaxID=3045158 RepID=A0AAU7ECU1_9FLAO|nr:hypothetical protein [Mariniflexile sp. KMM 9835]MDQ8212929.1 hypothetical protein [Mariniflexile sp. KMM 9835]